MEENTKQLLKLFGLRLVALAGIGAVGWIGYSCYAATQKRNEERLSAVENHAHILTKNVFDVKEKIPLLDTRLTATEQQTVKLGERDQTHTAQIKVLTNQYATLSLQQQKYAEEQQAVCEDINAVNNNLTHVTQETNARLAQLEEKLGYNAANVDTLTAKLSSLTTMQKQLSSLENNVNAITLLLKELQESDEEESPSGKPMITNVGYQIGDEVQYVSFVIKGANLDVLEKVLHVTAAYSGGLQESRKTTTKETPVGSVERIEVLYRGTINGVYLRNMLLMNYNRKNSTASVFLKLQGNSEADAYTTLTRTIPMTETTKEKYGKLETVLAQRR